MKRMVILPFLLCLVFLAACGGSAEPAASAGAAPWPSHAPAATPYVRLQTEPAAAPPEEGEREEGEHYDSWEELIQSMYTEVEGHPSAAKIRRSDQGIAPYALLCRGEILRRPAKLGTSCASRASGCSSG